MSDFESRPDVPEQTRVLWVIDPKTKPEHADYWADFRDPEG
jgi:hypothetical protein